MPFQSQAQRVFMYSQHPSIAKRWEKETSKGKLPKHKKSKSYNEGAIKEAQKQRGG